MRGQRDQMRQATTAEVRLDAGKQHVFSASARSMGRFHHLLPSRSVITLGPDQRHCDGAANQDDEPRVEAVERVAAFSMRLPMT
jgi:hypothetical protein